MSKMWIWFINGFNWTIRNSDYRGCVAGPHLRCFREQKNLKRWSVWSFLPLLGVFVVPPELSLKKWPKKQSVRWLKCEYDLKMVLTDPFGALIIVAAWPDPIFDALEGTKIWAGGQFGRLNHFLTTFGGVTEIFVFLITFVCENPFWRFSAL